MFHLFKYIIYISVMIYFIDSSYAECNRQKTKFGFICKCTTDDCDYFKEPVIEDVSNWIIISSSKNGLRFFTTEGRFGSAGLKTIEDYMDLTTRNVDSEKFNADAVLVDNQRSLGYLFGQGQTNVFSLLQNTEKSTSSITIDRNKTYQKIIGFGGALTGSVSFLLENMPSKLQNHIYKSYYHQDGIGFNMLRTTIGGCDFDLEPWAYNETPKDDLQLSNFTQLDERDLLKVKQIRKIKSVGQLENLKIMAAAWSPPPWMKSNSDWTGYSSLKMKYYETWAEYHMRYLERMHNENITIWAISTGNEPLNGVIGWLFVRFMSLGWTPQSQALYLNNYLGPMLKKSQFKNVLIFGNDDQRYSYPTWLEKMNETIPDSLKYLDGFAVHWYWDDIFGPELIDKTMQLFPNKFLLNTESCVGDKPWQAHGPELGSWERGEQYIRAFLQDLQHNFNGWIDWNLILNENGGPNYVNNTVDAPIVVNTKNYQEFYKQPIYYGIGHFSKFIKPDSKRVQAMVTSPQNSVDAVAFHRPDDTMVLIIFNSAPISQDITINDSVRGSTEVNVPARSIHTMLFK
ncbi:lysosomal acid glucosylceramidase-like [Haematobia irritans]|uniref:lysosomal acid glucosylceramidase-like n=1 Tax=Haematobia irritans TaxID=7368 RepID=UPI003F4F4987